MSKKLSYILLVLFFIPLSFSGCSKEEIKKSDNSNRIHALYLSLDLLKKNYEARNPSDFLSGFDPSFQNLDQITINTRDIFNQFNPITLHLYLDHIELEPASSSLVIRWDGEWTPIAKPAIRASGNAIFRFSGEVVPHLIEIQGISPFIPPFKEKGL
jgi:hypothetical protein